MRADVILCGTGICSSSTSSTWSSRELSSTSTANSRAVKQRTFAGEDERPFFHILPSLLHLPLPHPLQASLSFFYFPVLIRKIVLLLQIQIVSKTLQSLSSLFARRDINGPFISSLGRDVFNVIRPLVTGDDVLTKVKVRCFITFALVTSDALNSNFAGHIRRTTASCAGCV